MEYKRENIYKAVFFFLFSRKRYISLAINHGMAINLEAPDLRKMHEEGKYPNEGWEVEVKRSAIEASIQVNRSLWSSFSYILIVALIPISIAYLRGSVNPSFSVNHSLLVTFIGTFLASWATLMKLGGGFATFSGEALHELIHPAMFKLLFILGVCLLLLGVVA